MKYLGSFKIIKSLKRTFWYVALVCVVLSSFGPAQTASAAIPKYINFQGKLTKVSDGTNIANGAYAFEFKMYDASAAGNLLWTETYDQANGACGKLTVTNAIFNAKLGSCNSLSGVDFTGGSLYLSVNFAPTGTSYDGEMSPRKQLVASPFAFIANGVSGDGKIDIANTGTNQATIGYDSSNKLQVNVGSTGFTTLTANGSGAGFNLAGGNVGIGTTSPAEKLQITGGGILLDNSNTSGISIKDAGGTARLVVALDASNNFSARNPSTSGNAYYGLNQPSNTTGSIYFQTAGNNVMTILNGGNVGIGTTSPAQKLEVAGNVRVNDASDNQGFIFANGGTDRFKIYQNGTILNFASQSGALGQTFGFSGGTMDGTTGGHSATLFNVSGTWNQAADTLYGVKLNITDTNSGAASKLLDIQKGGTSQFNVDKNGNVGVGTTTATSNVTVYNATSPTISIYRPNAGTGSPTLNLFVAGSASGNLSFDGTFKLRGGGSGTTEVADFGISSTTLYGDLNFGKTTDTAAKIINANMYGTSGGDALLLKTFDGVGALSTRFGITGKSTTANAYFTSTNVGIGTTAPGSLFAVGSTSQFAINSSGAITTATGITSSGTITFSGLTAGGVVQATAGTGVLTVGTLDASAITADSLDFAQFVDAMTLDASTDIAVTGSNALSITNSGTGNSLVVNDASGDTTPFVIAADGNVGVGTTSASSTLHVNGDITVSNPSYSGTGFFRQSGNGTTSIGGGPSGLITFGPSNRTFFNDQQVVVPSGGLFAVGSNAAGGNLITVANSIAGRTTSWNQIGVTSTGTFDTTAGALSSYGGNFSVTSTRSAGSNALTNIGLYATASGAQNNYAAIFDAGNVGIGTTTPAAKLQIDTTVGGADALILRDTTNSANARLYFTTPIGAASDLNISASRVIFPGYAIRTGRIEGPSGSVNIDAALTVTSASTFSVTTGVANTTIFSGGTTSNTVIRPYSSSYNVQIAPSGGYVGIGTTTPDAVLELAGNQSASAWGLNGIALQGTAATYTDSSTAGSGTATNAVFNSFGVPTLAATNASVTTTNAANVYIAGAPTAGTNQTITNAYSLWVDDGNARFDGNVGIGTTSASQKLEVAGIIKGNADGANALIMQDGAGNSAFRSVRANSWADTQASQFFQVGGSSDKISFTALNGTAMGRLQFSSASTQITAGSYISTPAANGIFEIVNSSNSQIVTVLNGGNVGIGTTNPSAFKLQVAGNIGPDADSTYDLGSSSKNFNNTYSRSVISGGNLQVTAGIGGGTISFAANGSGTLFNIASTGITANGGVPITLDPGSANALTVGSAAGASRSINIHGQTTFTTGVSTGLVTAAVKAATSQTADLFQWQNSSGTALGVINVSGNVGIGTTSPAELLHVAGDIMQRNTRTRTMTRTLPTVVNDAVDIGSFTLSQGAGSLWVSITVPGSGFSVSKEYLLPIKYSQTSSTWAIAPATSSTGSYGGNDFDLDINVAGGTTSLRIRRTGGSTAGTAYIVIQQDGVSTDTFTASTSTASVSAPTAYFTSTALTQVGGNVGIGTTAPAAFLHVVSSSAAEGLRVADSGGAYLTFKGNLGSGNPGISSSSGLIHIGSVINGTGGSEYLRVRKSSSGTVIQQWENNAGTALSVVDGSGNIGIGDTSPAAALTVGSGDLFQVNSSGAIAAATGITSSGTITFSGLTAGGVVQATAGTGVLTVGTLGASAITADALDFTEFQDQLDLDASTDILADGSEVLSITNSGTGNSLVVNDASGDTTPFVIAADGNVGVGTSTATQKLEVNGAILANQGTSNRTTKLTDSGLYISRTSDGSYQSSIVADGSMTYGTRNDHIFQGDGVEIMRIVQANKSVGIGTSNPDAWLELGGAKSQSAWGLNGIALQGTAATYTDSSTAVSGTATNAVFNSFGQPTLAASNTGVTTTNAATVYIADAPAAGTNQTITNPYSLWVDNGTARFDGNVGIGTTVPGFPLQVSGNANVTGSLQIGTEASKGVISYTTNTLSFNNIGANQLVLANGVSTFGSWADGITYTLQAVSGGTGNSNRAGVPLLIASGNSTGSGTASYIALQTSPTGSSGTSENTAVERVRIDGVGNVGVGTTTPTALLHVKGTDTSSATKSFSVQNSSAADGFYTTNDSYSYLGKMAEVSDNTVYHDSTVAFSVSSNAKTYLGGFYDGGTARLIVKRDGNVGIGTTTPSTLFDVNGEARVRGRLPTTGLSLGSSGSGYSSIGYNIAHTASGNTWNYLGGDTASLLEFYDGGFRFKGTATVGVAGNPVTFIDILHLGKDGNVGIGTTTPVAKLTIGSGTPTTAANGLNFGTDTSANLYRSASATIKTDGAFTATGAISSSSNVVAGSSSLFKFTNQSSLYSPADGQITLYNNALSGFTLLQFGGASTSFPALKRSTTTLQARLADDSGYTAFDAGSYLINGTSINTAGTLNNVAYLNQANTFSTGQNINPGSAVTALAITQSYNAVGINISKAASGAAMNISSTSAQASGLVYSLTDATTSLMNGHTYGVSSVLSTGYDNYSTTAGNFSASQTRTTAGSNGDLAIGVDATASSAIATAGTYGYAGRFTAGSANIMPLLVKGAASQTSDLFQIQNSAGTGLFAVSSAGNVGIGTTTPVSALDVRGIASIKPSGTGVVVGLDFTNATNQNPVIRYGDTADDLGLKIYQGANLIAAFQDNGYVKATTGFQTFGGMTLGDYFVQRGTSDAGLTIPGSNILTFGSGTITSSTFATEYGRFNGSGNLGIGTTTVSEKLHVVGNGYLTGTLQVNAANTTGSANAPHIKFETDGGNGQVGLWYDPDNNGSLRLGANSTEVIRILGSNGSYTNGYTYMNGFVGIGSTTPTAKLNISGDQTWTAWGLNGIALQNSAATFTDSSTAISGTATNAAISSFGQPTIAASNTTVTTTNAFTQYIAGAPISGTNQTLTNTTALYIAGTATTDGAGGTPTNSYGLYVNPQTGATNNYAAVFASGNVGIGTVSPAQPLDVAFSRPGGALSGRIYNTSSATGSDDASLVLQTTGSGGGDPYIAFSNAGNFVWYAGVDNSDSDKFKIATGNAIGTGDLFTINTSGYVGIGTTAPSSMLHMRSDTAQIIFTNASNSTTATIAPTSGSLTISASGVGNGILFGNSDTYIGPVTNGSMDLGSTGQSRRWRDLYLTRDAQIGGNVGIGTTSPDYALELSGATAPEFAMSDTGLAHGVTTWAQTDSFINIEQVTNDDGGARIMGFSDAAGLNPLRFLGVFGNTDPTDSTPALWLLGGKRSGTDVANLGDAETLLQVGKGGDGSGLFTIMGNGNVGVGNAATAPAAPLDVVTASQNVARFKTTGAAHGINIALDSASTYNTNISYRTNGVNKWYEGNDATNDRFRLINSDANGNAELFTVLQGGNVGIGTTNPQSKFSLAAAAGSNTVEFGIYNDAGATKIGRIAQDNNLKLILDGYNTAGVSLPTGLSVGTSGYASATPPTGGAIIQGNVGIGTTAPAQLFDVVSTAVKGTTATTAVARFQSGDAANKLNLVVSLVGNTVAASSGISLQATETGVANRNLFLNPNNGNVGIGGTTVPTNALSVTGSLDVTGNVGIGTTAPSTKLEVTGDISLTSGATRYVKVANPTSSASGNDLVLQAATANTSGSGGSVYLVPGSGAGGPGAGTIYLGNAGTWVGASVSGTLTVSNAGPNTGNALVVSAGGQNGLTISWDNLTPYMQYGLVSARQSRFTNSSSYTFDNNVGIGTTTVSARLHSLATTEQLRLGYDASNYASFTTGSTGNLSITPSGGTTILTGAAGTANGTAALRVTDATNATFRMSFDNTGVIQMSGHNGHVLAFGAKDGDTSAFTERMRIVTSSGNIGIGTSSPDALLELAGSRSQSAWGLNGIALQGTAATYTDSSTAGSGTATNAVFNSFGVPTLAATNASVTTTNAANVYIAGAPAAGTNQTITNAYSLWVDDGNARFDGNVGIGTTSPITALQVEYSASNTNGLTIGNYAGGNYSQIFHETGSNKLSLENKQAGGISFKEGSSAITIDGMAIYGTSDFYLQHTGGFNVGIGTTTASAKLHVISTTEQMRLGYNASNYASFTTSSGGDLTVAPSGGDTSITGTLSASGVISQPGSGTRDVFTFGDFAGSTWSWSTGGNAGTNGVRLVQLGVSDRLAITSSSGRFIGLDLYVDNRLGVGTTSPDATLEFAGNRSQAAWGLNGVSLQGTAATYTDSSTAISGTATNAVFNSFGQPTLAASNTSVTTTNAATVYIADAPAAGTNQTITNPYSLWVDNGTARFDGGVGIGTTTLASNVILGMQGASKGIAYMDTNASIALGIGSADSSHSTLYTGSNLSNPFATAVMSFDLAGNVGIGTTTTSGAKVSINGNVGIGTSTASSLLNIGSGTPTTAASGLMFGTDTSANLYRSASATIKTDGNFLATGWIDSSAIRVDGSQVFDTSGLRLDVGNAGGFTTLTLGSGASAMVQLGGTTSAFPALKRSTTTLQARLADDSAYTSIDALSYLISGADINTAGTLTNVAYENQANTFTANNIFQPTVTTGTGATAGVQIAANSLTSGNGLDVSSTSLTAGNVTSIASTSTAGAAAGTSTLLNLSRSGANANTAHTAYGLYSTVTNTNATSGTNIAAYLSASGATTANYGLIVAAGNVGIGTTTPFSGATVTSSLELGTFNGANADGNLIVRGYAALGGISKSAYGAVGSNYYVDSANALKAKNSDHVSLIDFSAGGFLFKSAGVTTANTNISLSETMRLTSGGNLGIGTTSPAGKLDVVGGTALFGTTSGDTYITGNSINGQYGTNANGTFYINYTGYQAGTTQFRDTQISNGKTGNILFAQGSTGNVGIGTTSPTAKLFVSGTIQTGNDVVGAITLGRMDNASEGAQIDWTGGGNGASADYDTWTTDVYQNSFRTFTNSASANLYQVFNNGAGEAHLTVEGSLGIGTLSTPSAKLEVVSGATTGIAQSITVSSLTTGQGLNITGPTTTGVTGSGVLKVASDVGSAGTQGILAQFQPDFSAGTATSGYGLAVVGTDSTSVANSDTNFYSNLTLTGNAAKNGYASYNAITTSSTTADNTYAGLFSTTASGAISTGTRNTFGVFSNPSSTGANTGGTTQVFGSYSVPSSTGSTTGSTVNVFGNYIQNTATLTTAGTITSYGMYIANGSMNTTGTTTQYGIYIAEQTGADTNYAIELQNVMRIYDNGTESTIFSTNSQGLTLSGNRDADGIILAPNYGTTGTVRIDDSGGYPTMEFRLSGSSLSGTMGASSTSDGFYIQPGSGRFSVLQTDAANAEALYINTEESTTTQAVFSVESDTTNGSGADTVKFKITADGSVYSDANVYSTPADVAEMYYDVTGDLEAGELVALGTYTDQATGEQTFGVHRMENTSTRKPFGVISTKPGPVLGYDWKNPEILAKQKPVALVGRVPVKVTLENGPIKRGDQLTNSPTQPGFATKAIARGYTIGHALEDFDGTNAEQTTVLVFVDTDAYSPTVAELLQASQDIGQQPSELLNALSNLNMQNAEMFGDIVVNGKLYVQQDLHVKGVLYAMDIQSEKVTTKELCLEDVCINKNQLQQILQILQNGTANTGNPGGQVAGDSDTGGNTTPPTGNDGGSESTTPPPSGDEGGTGETPPPAE